jgi:hypothetical protein
MARKDYIKNRCIRLVYPAAPSPSKEGARRKQCAFVDDHVKEAAEVVAAPGSGVQANQVEIHAIMTLNLAIKYSGSPVFEEEVFATVDA